MGLKEPLKWCYRFLILPCVHPTQLRKHTWKSWICTSTLSILKKKENDKEQTDFAFSKPTDSLSLLYLALFQEMESVQLSLLNSKMVL